VLFYTTKGKLIKISKENIWAIGIFKGKDPLHIAPDEMINNPVIDASAVNDVHAAFVADPFLWRKDSLWYLFFEVLNKKDMKGDIGYAFSSDCRKWQYGKIVVDCLYHISYPYIFSWNDSIFMIPESAEAGFLSIYYAKEFPERWEIVDTILYGAYGDHGVIRYDNLWWIFACSEPVKNNELKLYYSDCLYGNWIEHPSSPIVQNDDSKARPGGRMLFLNNQIIRFAQNCNKTYGIEVNAFTITKMDKERYAETKSGTNPVVKRGNNKWALHGMHNVDAFKISDSEYVAAVDGYNKKIVLSIEF
ncbi:MAG TPA: hypothetical protein VHO70_01255, partial [Chitinispirillaceae bacterium]|nr:hypothetical protein [Chitinispirillaceae bacterium]